MTVCLTVFANELRCPRRAPPLFPLIPEGAFNSAAGELEHREESESSDDLRSSRRGLQGHRQRLVGPTPSLLCWYVARVATWVWFEGSFHILRHTFIFLLRRGATLVSSSWRCCSLWVSTTLTSTSTPLGGRGEGVPPCDCDAGRLQR